MNQPVKFLEYVGGTIALFEINRDQLVGVKNCDGIVVMCEFDYTNSEALLMCHAPYTSLEEIQQKLGNRLELIKVDQSEEFHCRTRCFYSFKFGFGKYRLAFPASGEECYFRIYAVHNGQLILQYAREL